MVAASAAVVSVPERVSAASAAALSTLWSEAQELANESLNVAQAAWDAERAEDLKAALGVAQGGVVSLTAELERERAQHASVRGRVEGLTGELATVKARAEAQGQVQAETAQRLTRLEAELVQARESAEAAREAAAQLTGRAESLQAQHGELMAALKARDGERPAAKGGKK